MVKAGLGVFVFGLGLLVAEGIIIMIHGVLLGVTKVVPVPVTCGDPTGVTEAIGVDGVWVVCDFAVAVACTVVLAFTSGVRKLACQVGGVRIAAETG